MARSKTSLSSYKGRYHRTLGRSVNSKGKVGPKKFLLGTDESEALRVVERLERLWDDVVRLHAEEARRLQQLQTHGGEYSGSFDRITGRIIEESCNPDEVLWDQESLAIADAIRDGQVQIEVHPSAHEPPPQSYVERIADLKRDYSVIAFVPADLELYLKGQRLLVKAAKGDAAASRQAADLAQIPAPKSGEAMLHDALDAFNEWARNHYVSDGMTSLYGKKLAEVAKRLKGAHKNIPLSQLSFASVEGMTDYWCQRPATKRPGGSGPISTVTVANTLKVLRQFLRWLHRSPDFGWRDQDRIIEDATKRTVRSLLTASERKRSSSGPESWTVAELGVLLAHARPFEMTFLLLGINGGFAQSECRHLMVSEVRLDSDPPHVDYVRHKTSKRGGFALWPETIEAITQHRERLSPEATNGSEWYFLTVEGQPYPTQSIANMWNRLLDRVQEQHPKFRRLPFKFLRKTNAQLHRDLGGADGEVIAIMQARAKVSVADDQADRYYRRRFDRVFECNARVREALQSAFDGAGEAEGVVVVQQPTEPPTRVDTREVKRLFDRYRSVSRVARELGVHRNTVYRHLKNDEGAAKSG